jgi:glycosyl transferase family 25
MIDCYLINLDRDDERLRFMSQRLNQIGVKYDRCSAVDARAMSKTELSEFRKLRSHLPWHHDGQIGCFLSHFEIWKRIAGGSAKFGAVLEDDEHLSASLKNVLSDDSWIPEDCDIVRLEASTNRLLMDKTAMALVAGRPVYRLRSTSWCTGAYIISRECAAQLISLPAKTHQVLDYFLFCHETSRIAAKLVIYQVSPALAIQDGFLIDPSSDPLFDSKIVNHSRSFGSKLAAIAKKLSPSSIVLALVKTARGYKRVNAEIYDVGGKRGFPAGSE